MKFIIMIVVILIIGVVFYHKYAVRIKQIYYFVSSQDYVPEIKSLDIWKNTKSFKLAKAVRSENIGKIKKIIKNEPDLIDYQEEIYGASMLIWAVGNEKYKSAEALLECGCNPDLWTKDGKTALFVASGFSWIDTKAKTDPQYVNLLLSYNADPNINYIGLEPIYDDNGKVTYKGGDLGISPLINSIGCGIEKTKALVEGGADINHKTDTGITAAVRALTAGGGSVLLERREYAYYLIVEKNADVTQPYKYGKSVTLGEDEEDDFHYPINLLRHWVVDLDSYDYEIKMAIVEEFERQGINYWETEIDKYTLELIKRSYPDTWQEYIKKY